MANEKVGYGIIGAGNIANFHAQALAMLDNSRLVGFYDKITVAAERMAKKWNCKAYTNFQDFLADPEIQAVTIATPSGLHGSVAIPAAKAGKHILCEKPLDITIEKANAIAQACEDNNVILSPVFQARFTPTIVKVRDAIRKGRLGRTLFASARVHWYREPGYYAASPWRGTWGMDGGGALMNQSIHAIDLLIYLNGSPAEVFSYAGTMTHSIEVEDTLCAAIKFRNGSFGTIEVSTSCAPGFARYLEIAGSEGSIAFEDEKITRWEFVNKLPEDEGVVGGEATEVGSNGSGDPNSISAEGHAKQLNDLSNAILHGGMPELCGREGCRAVELICGIYESARTGKPYVFGR